MLIDFQIFKWLVDIKVIPNTQKLQIRGDGQIEANEEIMNIIRNGTIFTEIIRSLRRKTQQSLGIRLQSPSNLRQLKNANTSAVRLYNWNIIIETLSHLHYEIENDTKTLIVAGDEDVAMQILKDIYSRILMLDKGNKGRSGSSSGVASLNSSIDIIERIGDQSFSNMHSPGKVDSFMVYPNRIVRQQANYKLGISSFVEPSGEVTLESTESLEELLLVSLSKAFSLTPKQSAALFSNDKKYLAHLVTKGFRGSFEPVIRWYKEMYLRTSHICHLIKKEGGIEACIKIFQKLKLGLHSRDPEVSQWTCQTLKKLAKDCLNNKLHLGIIEWFFGAGQGLYDLLSCLKRVPNIEPYVAAVLAQISEDNFSELFTNEMKSNIKDPLEYTQIILMLLKPLTDIDLMKDRV